MDRDDLAEPTDREQSAELAGHPGELEARIPAAAGRLGPDQLAQTRRVGGGHPPEVDQHPGETAVEQLDDSSVKVRRTVGLGQLARDIENRDLTDRLHPYLHIDLPTQGSIPSSELPKGCTP